MTTKRDLLRVSAATLLSMLFSTTIGCKKESTESTPPAGSASAASSATATTGGVLNGAGSTFVNPLMSRWSAEYQKVDANAKINYQSIGSGGGIRQLTARTVAFGATDGPMTDVQLAEAKSPVVHIPVTMGAVVPTYNLAELEGKHPIQFTPEVLADIFLGKITKWNDPKIASANKDLKLPASTLTVVHRSDGSGTTFIWTDYLSKVSPEWKEKVGNATSVQWPVGLGGRGNEGVAGTVKQTPGSIGYVELTYARQNKMAAGSVRNRAGAFVEANIPAVTAAAAGALDSIPADLRYSITDAPGAAAWPISGTTWVVLYQDASDDASRKTVSFLRWALHDGQKFCESLDYAPLPDGLIKLADAKLDTIGAVAAGKP